MLKGGWESSVAIGQELVERATVGAFLYRLHPPNVCGPMASQGGVGVDHEKEVGLRVGARAASVGEGVPEKVSFSLRSSEMRRMCNNKIDGDESGDEAEDGDGVRVLDEGDVGALREELLIIGRTIRNTTRNP